MYKLKKIFKNEKGQGMVEYGLILATVSIVAILGLSTLGGSIKDQFEGITNSMGGISEPGQGPGYSDEEIDNLIVEGYIPVATADELNNVRDDETNLFGKGTKWEKEYIGGLDKKYVQVLNIDLSEYSEGEGWTPIGTEPAQFTGSFNGNGYKITGLTINRPETSYVGLFGYTGWYTTDGVTISNVALENIKVTGKYYVGGLAGIAQYDVKISNSYATGTVTGEGTVGGLVGYADHNSTISNSYATGSVDGTGRYTGGLAGRLNYDSTIENSYSTGTVTGLDSVGGLVGWAHDRTNIENSYATGSVTGSDSVGGLVGSAWSKTVISNSCATGAVDGTDLYAGGLVGWAYDSTIKKSHATGSVTGANNVGGLVGSATNGSYSSTTIEKSHATGSVTGTDQVGGLVGYSNHSTISNTYATGSVEGNDTVGGLVGWAFNNTEISNSYSIGLAKGSGENVGGLIGSTKYLDNGYQFSSAITGSYWNKETALQEESAGGEGETTVDMMKQTTYEGWDFESVWKIDAGDYPKLR